MCVCARVCARVCVWVCVCVCCSAVNESRSSLLRERRQPFIHFAWERHSGRRAPSCRARMKSVWIMTNTSVTIWLTHIAPQTQTHCVTSAFVMDGLLKPLHITNIWTDGRNCARQFTHSAANHYHLNYQLIVFLINHRWKNVRSSEWRPDIVLSNNTMIFTFKSERKPEFQYSHSISSEQWTVTFLPKQQ